MWVLKEQSTEYCTKDAFSITAVMQPPTQSKKILQTNKELLILIKKTIII